MGRALRVVHYMSRVLCALCSEVLHSTMCTEWPSVSLLLIGFCFPFVLFNKLHDTQYFIKKKDSFEMILLACKFI